MAVCSNEYAGMLGSVRCFGEEMLKQRLASSSACSSCCAVSLGYRRRVQTQLEKGLQKLFAGQLELSHQLWFGGASTQRYSSVTMCSSARSSVSAPV